MKKKFVAAIILGAIVIASTSYGVISAKMTAVSFGLKGESQPKFTLYGFYDKGTSVYSADNYYLHLDHENGTFDGWYMAKNQHRYYFQGEFTIAGSDIKGVWHMNQVEGWISGHLGS
jgi:hypothetical protein